METNLGDATRRMIAAVSSLIFGSVTVAGIIILAVATI